MSRGTLQVALDARTMQVAVPGGIGRSLRNLLPLLEGSVDLHLLTDSHEPRIDTHLPQTALRQPVPGVHASWLQISASQWLRNFEGVFHCPFYAVPHSLPLPGIASIHDITYEHHPEWFSRRQRLSFRVQSRRAAQTAAIVLTGSEFVKQDIVNTYDISPDAVLVSPQGVDPVFAPGLDSAEVRARWNLNRPYVIALGGAVRRNLPTAVAAWRSVVLQGADVDLVVVGGEEPPAEPGITWVGRVADPDWAALLAGAVAFVYPTAYEGFGMPGLEALGAGTPVVAARVGALPEVLGDVAEWAESLAVVDVADAISRVLADPLLAAQLSSRGVARVGEIPGWEHAAAVHLEAYRRASAA